MSAFLRLWVTSKKIIGQTKLWNGKGIFPEISCHKTPVSYTGVRKRTEQHHV